MDMSRSGFIAEKAALLLVHNISEFTPGEALIAAQRLAGALELGGCAPWCDQQVEGLKKEKHHAEINHTLARLEALEPVFQAAAAWLAPLREKHRLEDMSETDRGPSWAADLKACKAELLRTSLILADRVEAIPTPTAIPTTTGG